jgi:hypothetical protein
MATSLILEYLTTGKVIVVFVISVVARLVVNALWAPTLPTSFAWVGEGQGLWPLIKGNITYVGHYSDWIQDGYKKVRFLTAASHSATDH